MFEGISHLPVAGGGPSVADRLGDMARDFLAEFQVVFRVRSGRGRGKIQTAQYLLFID